MAAMTLQCMPVRHCSYFRTCWSLSCDVRERRSNATLHWQIGLDIPGKNHQVTNIHGRQTCDTFALQACRWDRTWRLQNRVRVVFQWAVMSWHHCLSGLTVYSEMWNPHVLGLRQQSESEQQRMSLGGRTRNKRKAKPAPEVWKTPSDRDMNMQPSQPLHSVEFSTAHFNEVLFLPS